MFHLVLIAIVLAVSTLCWLLVNSAPRAVSVLLPRNLTFILGAWLLIIGLFCAFYAARYMGDSAVIIGCLIQSFVGLWLIFAGSAGLRGSDSYDQTTRRVGIMMALLIALILGAFYVPNVHFVALLNLGLITAGFFLAADLRRSPGR
jgi:putative Mn2+ efflux pump MntP